MPAKTNTRAKPGAFRKEYAEQARKLCRLGATDAELADFFSVSEETLAGWKNAHPEFLESVTEGRALADAEVAHSLFRRATGYSHPDVHVSSYQGEITVTEITKHYAPDTVACVFWLKNRRPDLWRDRRGEEEEGGEVPEAKSFSYTVVDGQKKDASDADAD